MCIWRISSLAFEGAFATRLRFGDGSSLSGRIGLYGDGNGDDVHAAVGDGDEEEEDEEDCVVEGSAVGAAAAAAVNVE
jgi:hypothetical protein